eukprot:SAG11_NODE_2328_length_3514_cov_3.922694_1_plen_54_part_00
MTIGGYDTRFGQKIVSAIYFFEVPASPSGPVHTTDLYSTGHVYSYCPVVALYY